MKNEIWKDIMIKGEVTNYEISNLKNVRDKTTGELLKKHSDVLNIDRVRLRIRFGFIRVDKLYDRAFNNN